MHSFTIKSEVFICLVIFAASVPLSASADYPHYFFKGAFGEMGGTNESLDLTVYASESATKLKSEKTTSSGGEINGNYYTGNQCWHGNGFTNNIKFKATGTTPSHITASGSALVTWNEYCSSHDSFTETVTFNIDLSAMTDQTLSFQTTFHETFDNIRVNTHLDSDQAPATVSIGSFITSPTYGTVSGDHGFVGRSKDKYIEISQ